MFDFSLKPNKNVLNRIRAILQGLCTFYFRTKHNEKFVLYKNPSNIQRNKYNYSNQSKYISSIIIKSIFVQNKSIT